MSGRREAVRLWVAGAEFDAVVAAGDWQSPWWRAESVDGVSSRVRGGDSCAGRAAAVAGATARGWLDAGGGVRPAAAGLCDVLCAPHGLIRLTRPAGVAEGARRVLVLIGGQVAILLDELADGDGRGDVDSDVDSDVDVVALTVVAADAVQGLVAGAVRSVRGRDAAGVEVLVVHPLGEGVFDAVADHVDTADADDGLAGRVAAWCRIACGTEPGQGRFGGIASHAWSVPVVGTDGRNRLEHE